MMRVLVADDDPTSVLLLESALTEWGYEPVIVRDGDAAWNSLRARSSSAGDPRLDDAWPRRPGDLPPRAP